MGGGCGGSRVGGSGIFNAMPFNIPSFIESNPDSLLSLFVLLSSFCCGGKVEEEAADSDENDAIDDCEWHTRYFCVVCTCE